MHRRGILHNIKTPPPPPPPPPPQTLTLALEFRPPPPTTPNIKYFPIVVYYDTLSGHRFPKLSKVPCVLSRMRFASAREYLTVAYRSMTHCPPTRHCQVYASPSTPKSCFPSGIQPHWHGVCREHASISENFFEDY